MGGREEKVWPQMGMPECPLNVPRIVPLRTYDHRKHDFCRPKTHARLTPSRPPSVNRLPANNSPPAPALLPHPTHKCSSVFVFASCFLGSKWKNSNPIRVCVAHFIRHRRET